MKEEWTKRFAPHVLYEYCSPLSQNCILFFMTRLLLFPLSIYKKKCSECMLQLSIPVNSGNILRILLVWLHHSLLDFFRFIRWVHSVDRGCFLNGAKKMQKLTKYRRRTNELSQPRIILLCQVSSYFSSMFLMF